MAYDRIGIEVELEVGPETSSASSWSTDILIQDQVTRVPLRVAEALVERRATANSFEVHALPVTIATATLVLGTSTVCTPLHKSLDSLTILPQRSRETSRSWLGR